MKKWLRRKFAFLFRHQFELKSMDFVDGIWMTTLQCAACGETGVYNAFDKKCFVYWYLKQGCPGEPDSKEQPGEPKL